MRCLKLYIIWTILTSFLMACTTTDWENEVAPRPLNPYEVRVKLNLSVVDRSLTTRASNSEFEDSDNEVAGEMMRNWFVVIVQEGKIVDIIKNEAFPSGEVERDKDYVFVDIPRASTTFYTFANLQLSDVGLSDDMIGRDLPSNFDLRSLTVNGNTTVFGTQMADVVNQFTDGIPMSNRQTFDITGDTENVQLEVVRMVAKVKLYINNTTDHDITIKGVSFLDVTPNEENNLKLFSAHLDQEKVNAPTLNTSHKQVLSLSPQNSNGYVVSSGEKQNICFYMNESEVTAENKYFILLLQTEDGASESSTAINRRYAMLDWRQINRNDYCIIPIKLDDYAIEWDVEAFSPIGVLPKVEDDGENMTITFGYYGEFHIKPKIKVLSSGNYLDASNVLNSTCTEMNSAPSGEESIFDVPPYWVSSPANRIEGEMGNRSGTAIYKLTMDVKKPNNTFVTLSRKIRFVMNAVDFSHSRFLPSSICNWQQVNVFKR